MIKSRFLSSYSLQTRMLAFFLSIFIVIILGLILPWALYMQQSAEAETKAFAVRRLESLDSGLNSATENLDMLIDIMMLTRAFDETMVRNDPLYTQRFMLDTLRRFLVNDMSITAAIFIDTEDTAYTTSSFDYGFKVYPDMLKDPEWVKNLTTNKLFMVPHSGGLLDPLDGERRFLSFVRTINSIVDMRHLGTVVLNISAYRYGLIMKNYADEINRVYLLDETGTILAHTPNALHTQEQVNAYFSQCEKGAVIVSDEGQREVVCQLPSFMEGFTLLGVTALESSSGFMYNSPTTPLMIAVAAALVILLSQFYLSRSIGKPLKELCHYMQLAEMGEYVPIQPKNENARDEITQLQLFFNRMINSIDELVLNIGQRERLKRRHEIALLQEQIKPHFLYNALDAVSALSLIGDSETAYTLTQSLSAYYRSSLSSGHETVPVRTEIDCIKNYMTVLNIRYEHEINVHYDIDERMMPMMMLRLVLQPLVENAVYHGIRKRRGASHIWITGALKDSQLVLSVSDDGAGMTPERIEQVLQKQSRGHDKGFALYNVIEKIELFYYVNAPLTISERSGGGTTMTVTLPMLNADGTLKEEVST